MSSIRYWLMKSEPSLFSFDDLKSSPDLTTCWDGIRNYQARNYMRNDMDIGDEVLFYHSNCTEIGVVGTAFVSRKAYVDYTAFSKREKYYDKRSKKENPTWYMVDITWKEDFKRIVTLKEIKKRKELANMPLVQKGQRLSIQVVQKNGFELIKFMGNS